VWVARVVDGIDVDDENERLMLLSMLVLSSTSLYNVSSLSLMMLYQREVWSIMENESVRDKLVENLLHSNQEASRQQHDHPYHAYSHHSNHCSYQSHHIVSNVSSSPSNSFTLKDLQMEVDYSHPFGRCDIISGRKTG